MRMIVLFATMLCACKPAAVDDSLEEIHRIWEESEKFSTEVSYSIPETSNELKVIYTSAHPFLAEYSRTFALVVDGETVAEQPLYPDRGGGASSSLYIDDDDNYVLIDMNGYWYGVDQTDRKISISEWRWIDTIPPKRYLGTFDKGTDKQFHFLSPEDSPEKSPYFTKDPDHPHRRQGTR